MKATFHKACDCVQCTHAKNTKAGQFSRNRNERKLRRIAKAQIKRFLQTDEEPDIAPISQPRLG